ncbi:hypothetical protein CLOM_g17979 [Closterium sp. NIES-68]|nr:hypothetical protein CLOM_g17979 [Closterium sp. NIES-68]GJP62986.1 hypothetical protein CLOP_g20041 [Closterium sp. NIES-67]
MLRFQAHSRPISENSFDESLGISPPKTAESAADSAILGVKDAAMGARHQVCRHDSRHRSRSDELSITATGVGGRDDKAAAEEMEVLVAWEFGGRVWILGGG